ncbi:MAG: hypothetical protein IKW65_07795 [Bacteroidales bacterium]|nr:hypothetical protein [Bacteroidales bacterium]
MKNKIIAIIAILLLSGSLVANGQVRYGVKAGYSYPGFLAGVAVNFNLPLGFAVQPEVQYMQKVLNMGQFGTWNIGFVEPGVGLQYGFDLILLRPFVAVTPFLSIPTDKDMSLNYGVGVGGGLDIWRFQVHAQYKWSELYEGFEIALGFFF